MGFLEYITQNATILIPALYIIGMFIKATPKIADWTIPWILVVLGIVGGIALVGFNADGIIQGVLVAGVTVLGNQIIKQTINKE